MVGAGDRQVPCLAPPFPVGLRQPFFCMEMQKTRLLTFFIDLYSGTASNLRFSGQGCGFEEVGRAMSTLFIFA